MTKLFTAGGSPVELPSGAEQVHLLGAVNYTPAGSTALRGNGAARPNRVNRFHHFFGDSYETQDI